jgi:integrase
MPPVTSKGKFRMTRTRYQQGCLKTLKRKGGHEAWIYRWREIRSDGKRRGRKIVVGSVRELRTEAAARQALEALKLRINLDLSETAQAPRTFADLVEHYKAKEMAEESEDHSFSTKKVYGDNIRLHILRAGASTRSSAWRKVPRCTSRNG